ncbi:hypothetical protein BKA83DRAFT_2567898 [Pisolithus microcarpus]|nr:hypothetical protein BKA83DRAFT_2567898 [Pisolithus microcarpus]
MDNHHGMIAVSCILCYEKVQLTKYSIRAPERGVCDCPMLRYVDMGVLREMPTPLQFSVRCRDVYAMKLQGMYHKSKTPTATFSCCGTRNRASRLATYIKLRGLWGIRTANPHVQLMALFLDPCIDSDVEKRLEPEASKKDRFKSTCGHQAPHHFRTQGGTYYEYMGPAFFSRHVATRADLTA